MKYSTPSITLLSLILNGDASSASESSDPLQSITEFVRLSYNAKPQGFNYAPDIGILDIKHRSMSGVLACPADCTNLALCDCIRAYYNSEGDESCLSVMLSGCKNDEFTSCYPVDDSRGEYVGKDWANTYLYCSIFQCLDSLGIISLFDNSTSAAACTCDGIKTMCEKCYEMRDSVPYCEYLLTSYEGWCADTIDCCKTKADPEEMTKCMNVALGKAKLENANKGTEETPSINTEDSKIDSANKEETSESNSSVGLIRSGIGYIVAATTLAAGVLGHFNI